MRRIALHLLVDHWNRRGPLNWDAIFGRTAPLWVDIGFGRGETLVRWAQAASDRNIVGIETAWASIQRALRRLHQAGVTNVRILHANADWALYFLWPSGRTEYIMSLFPDPWPKARHAHHRLFSRRFFLRAHRALAPGGRLLLVTDEPSFVEWSQGQCPTTHFRGTLDTYRNEVRFGTKYEEKWYRASRTFYVLEWIRLDAPTLPEPPWPEAMRIYRWTGNFEPERIPQQATWHEDDVVIALKEWVWDPTRAVCLIKVVIVEDTLTQHVWIEVRRVGETWRLMPSDGCKFMPTWGLQKALDRLAALIAC